MYHAVSWGGGEKKTQKIRLSAPSLPVVRVRALSWHSNGATCHPGEYYRVTEGSSSSSSLSQRGSTLQAATQTNEAKRLIAGWSLFYFFPSFLLDQWWVWEKLCVCVVKKERKDIKDTQQQAEERAAWATAHQSDLEQNAASRWLQKKKQKKLKQNLSPNKKHFENFKKKERGEKEGKEIVDWLEGRRSSPPRLHCPPSVRA